MLMKSQELILCDDHKPCFHLQGTYISMLYKCILNENEDTCAKDLITISPNTRDSVTLLNHRYGEIEGDGLKITLYLNIKYTYSALLTSVQNEFNLH